tara:strand:+ start:373 stop:582 length:210 start_codon:yes stop_codon:yes gene_type:complete
LQKQATDSGCFRQRQPGLTAPEGAARDRGRRIANGDAIKQNDIVQPIIDVGCDSFLTVLDEGKLRKIVR